MSRLKINQELQVKKRLKAMFYGTWKAGKTTAALQFPRPYFIDTEDGASHPIYTDLMKSSQGNYVLEQDFDEILEHVKGLALEKHHFKTLVIDSLTTVYDDLLDRSAEELISASDPTGTNYNRHKAAPDRKMKRLFNWLTRLDMNVIITTRAKADWKKVEGDDTFDCFKGTPYFFDVIVEVRRRSRDQRFAYVKGSRLKGLPEDEEFKFSYEEFKKRCGTEMLECDSDVIVLATPEQVEKMKKLIDVLKFDEATLQKWLDKAMADSWEEMTQTDLAKCIDHLTTLLPK